MTYSPKPTIRLCCNHSVASLAAKSAGCGDLIIDCAKPWLARFGIVVVVPRPTFKQVLPLLMNPRHALTMPEIVDAIWADDVDGGPLDAANLFYVHLNRIRPLFPLLGLTLIKHAGGRCIDLGDEAA